MSNRIGWVRLGIIFSAVWVILMCAVAGYEYFADPQSGARWFVTYDGWEIPSLKVGRLLAAAFVPAGAGWVLIPSTAWAVSWVRAGFRP